MNRFTSMSDGIKSIRRKKDSFTTYQKEEAPKLFQPLYQHSLFNAWDMLLMQNFFCHVTNVRDLLRNTEVNTLVLTSPAQVQKAAHFPHSQI